MKEDLRKEVLFLQQTISMVESRCKEVMELKRIGGQGESLSSYNLASEILTTTKRRVYR